MALFVPLYLLCLNCIVATPFSKLALCDFMQGQLERPDLLECRDLADHRALQGRLDRLDWLGPVEVLEQWENEEAVVYLVKRAPLGPMALLERSAQLGLEEYQVSHGSSLWASFIWMRGTLTLSFWSGWCYNPHFYHQIWPHHTLAR